MNDTQAYCPSCGKPTKAAPPPPVPNRVAGHVRLLGIFWLAYSAVQLMGSWFLSSIFPRLLVFQPSLGGWSGGFPHFPFLVGGLLRAVGWLLLARGVLGVIAGWGLLDRQPWARILAIVLAVFTLFHLILGAALGIYTLWVLLPGESERDYRQLARPA